MEKKINGDDAALPVQDSLRFTAVPHPGGMRLVFTRMSDSNYVGEVTLVATDPQLAPFFVQALGEVVRQQAQAVATAPANLMDQLNAQLRKKQ